MTNIVRITTIHVEDGDEIHLPESAQVLDSVHHARGLKLTLLEPNGEYQCGVETSAGEPCERTVEYPTDTCHQHD